MCLPPAQIRAREDLRRCCHLKCQPYKEDMGMPGSIHSVQEVRKTSLPLATAYISTKMQMTPRSQLANPFFHAYHISRSLQVQSPTIALEDSSTLHCTGCSTTLSGLCVHLPNLFLQTSKMDSAQSIALYSRAKTAVAETPVLLSRKAVVFTFQAIASEREDPYETDTDQEIFAPNSPS